VVECVGRGRRTPPIIVCPVPVGDAGFVAPVELAESAVAGEDIFIKNNLFFVVYMSEIRKKLHSLNLFAPQLGQPNSDRSFCGGTKIKGSDRKLIVKI
jgi:hypothetical protein